MTTFKTGDRVWFIHKVRPGQWSTGSGVLEIQNGKERSVHYHVQLDRGVLEDRYHWITVKERNLRQHEESARRDASMLTLRGVR